MKSNEKTDEFKAIAENLVRTMKENWNDLKSKWAPAGEEASQRFEDLKQQFKNTLKLVDENMQQWKSTHREEIDDVKRSIDELYVRLNLGKAEGMEAFENQKREISREWSLLKMKLEKLPEYQNMQQQLKQELMEWRIRLDLMKIQFALGKMEVKDSWKNISSEISKEAEHLGKAVEAGAGIAGEKLDHLEIEIRKIFDKFK